MSAKVYKTIFRRIGGRLRMLKVSVSSGADNSFYYSRKGFENSKKTVEGFKSFRKNPFERMKMYLQGGIKDPAVIANEDAIYKAHQAKTLREEMAKSHAKKFGSDEVTKARGKKSAEKLIGIFGDIENIIKGEPEEAISFTKEQALSLARKAPVEKRDYYDLLNADPKNKSGFLGDAASLLEKKERGGEGLGLLKRYANSRKRDAIRIQREIQTQLPRADKIDKIVNLRGKGVRPIKVNGKISFKRPKK